jgi:hypothetical protein
MTAIIAGSLLIFAGASFAVYSPLYSPLGEELKLVGKGLILGTLFSILNFVLMGETLPDRMDLSARKTFAKALGSILFRYALLAIPFVAAIKKPDMFNLFAVLIGVFMVQIMILLDHFAHLFRTVER